MGGRIHAVKENAEALVVGSKETGPENIVMSSDQTAGLNHNVKVDNKSLERVEYFKYLGTTLTNQNSIHEKLRAE